MSREPLAEWGLLDSNLDELSLPQDVKDVKNVKYVNNVKDV